MLSSGPSTYDTLSFSAIHDGDRDRPVDTTFSDRVRTLASDIPVAIDLDFDFDFEGRNLDQSMSTEQHTEDVEMRSPRSPTFSHRSPLSPSANSPFDPSRFFTFPLDPPSPNDSSPLSPRRSLIAKPNQHLDALHDDDDSKENFPPVPPPPKRPLSWIWTCHLCHSRYPLGATRRCLVDGHYYCSGDNSGFRQRNVKRKKKNQSCSSEFDYTGWQAWGHWKKEAVAAAEQPKLADPRRTSTAWRSRGCEVCEYPSQCRYEKLNKYPDVIPVSPKNTKPSGSGDDDKTGAEQTSGGRHAGEKKKKRGLTVDTGLQAAGGRAGVQCDKDHPSLERDSRSDGTQTEPAFEKPTKGGEGQAPDSDNRGDGSPLRRESTRTSVHGMSANISSVKGAKSYENDLLDESRLKQSRISDFFGVRR